MDILRASTLNGGEKNQNIISPCFKNPSSPSHLAVEDLMYLHHVKQCVILFLVRIFICIPSSDEVVRSVET